ncbi:MAG: CHASE2 domain-containing protein [Elusimicrobia bacterium]|nr:CHASE2 domain-containing protein [Elusimicrobiota bacterium]
MKKIIFSNLLWGSALLSVTLFFYFTGTGLETAELKFYDFRAKMSAASSAKNEIAIIEINDDTISKIGRWPWPRSEVADMLLWLSSSTARPSVIGLNILFSEPEKNSELELGDYLKSRYLALVADKKIKETTKDSDFSKIIDEAQAGFDNDPKLAAAVADAGNVVLPMLIKTGESSSKPEPEPQWLKKFSPAIGHSAAQADIAAEGSQITVPLEVMGSSAAGVGYVNVFADSDGTLRREYPFSPYDRSFYPSFASEIVRVRLKLTPQEVIFSPGALAAFGHNKIPLDQSSSVLVAFNKNKSSFKHYSFYDVMSGKIVPETFKNKIVLIGFTAQGMGAPYATPVESNLQAVEFTANVIGDILEGRFISRPEWASQAELGLIVFAGLLVIFLLPRLNAGLGAGLTVLLSGSLVGWGIFLFTSKSMWLKTLYPSCLLVAGYILIVIKRFFSAEKKKEFMEVSATETNKMLGLYLQGQGMLDLAFEKFLLCPGDGTMKDLLYNLALDFERKLQFSKAVAVYGHISLNDPAYKDIKDKMEMLTKASNEAVVGGGPGEKPVSDAAMPVEESSTSSSAISKLGRYEITKELGKGEMGMVYLGRDPKINRLVALKTMSFEEGADEKTMKELKERFFREAQAAGKLSHPNIVKIFDTGEEKKTAYIAMEPLKGDSLKKRTAKGSLLPVDKVLEYIEKSSEALDYAHKNGIIHRDIRPPNIMLLEDGTVRVTNFGTAGAQESAEAATAAVTDSSYYISPEQIAGQKADGRADIFSLGVTMFELLTGARPWNDALGTLFFQITADPCPDPMVRNPALSKDIVAVIDRALKKKPNERYQTAGQMAEDIKNILRKKPLPAESPKAAAYPAKPSGWAPEQKKPVIAPQVKPAPAQAAAGPQSSGGRLAATASQAPIAKPQPQKPAPRGTGGNRDVEAFVPTPQPKPEAAKPEDQAQAPAPNSKAAGSLVAGFAKPTSGWDFEKIRSLIYTEEENKSKEENKNKNK